MDQESCTSLNASNEKVHEKSKIKNYNISEDAVEKLLENVLIGQTVVLPSEVFRSVSSLGGNSNLSLTLNSKTLSKSNAAAGKNSTSSDFSASNLHQATLSMDDKEKTVPDETFLKSWVGINNSNDFVFMSNDSLIEKVDNSSTIVEVESSEGRTTRPVTPTGNFNSARPVSEQFIQAKRVLNSNPFGVEAPNFQKLPADLEEAFTVSTAYLAQLIISSTTQLSLKYDSQSTQGLLNVSESQASGPESIVNGAENNFIQSNQQIIPKSIQEKSLDLSLNEKIQTSEPFKTSSEENCPPTNKPAYDPIANFELYLQRIKMPAAEITAHTNHARILTTKEASKYMAKFGFTPKKKK